MPSYSNWLVFYALLFALIVNGPSARCADEQAIFSGENVVLEVGADDEAKREMLERMKKEQSRRKGRGEPPKSSEGKPDEQKKKDEKKEGKPEDDKQEGGKEGGGSKTVKRPTEPKEPFDPRQYEAVKPDLDGRYRLSFVGTPWPPMIEWLEEISGRTADWQELPGDYFNLRTQRAYSVPEIEDIVNRLLLARGYTMLVDGELMTVEKTEGINASLVPRIPPEELRHHRPYEFARVLFDLDWLMAEQVAKELKPMVSKNGSLTAFTGTNRVEVMDAVRNLQQINEMINQEQSSSARDKLVQEFQLHHVAAKTVVTSLKELVGSGGGSGPKLSSKQIQQIQQQIQQMKQRRQDTSKLEQQLKAGSGGGGGGAVSFVINDQRNSIIATAPPNKMVIIERTIKLLDVQDGRNDSLDSYVGRIKPYRLISLNPTEVVKILTETGGLDPKTKLTADDDNKSLIASAPPWDHMTIQKLIDKLDGSTRQFHVLRIRRRRVDQVATTIQTLMVGEEKKDESRRYRWWDDGDDDETDKFRVAADIEHKQLLVWCNDQEYEQVLNLLQELGEVPERGTTPSKFRVLEEIPAREAEDFLKRVKEAFEQMAPNTVQIDPGVEESLRDAAERLKAEEAKKAEEEKKEKEAEDNLETDGSVPRVLAPETQDVRRDVDAATTAFVQATTPERTGPANRNSKPAAPVRISLDSNGRIVIQSDDPRALDLFEEISGQLMPRPKGFHVFKIKHGMATWIVLKLETFFEDTTKKDNDVPWWYFGDYPDDSDDKVGLGDRPEIKFVSEIDSNTIVVRNATESQLKTIEELLKIYDIPEPVDPKRTRYTTIYKVKHSRASLISETVKSAFPDLLSSNDSVVQRGRQKKNGNDDDDDKPSGGGGGLLLGQLSIGADDVTNTLIVSTKGEQLQNVLMPIIKRLDEEALKAETVKVYALPEGASSEIAESLSALLGSGKVKNKDGVEKKDGNEEQKEQQEREEARRRRGRRDGGQPNFGRRD